MPSKPPDPIPDAFLSLFQIPDNSSAWKEIANFALTFNGYEYWGSFQRCGEIANARRNDTLADLRTCLFFEQRRWQHFGAHPDAEAMEYILSLLDQIRAKVTSR